MANDIAHLLNYQIKKHCFVFFFKATIKTFKNMKQNHRADKKTCKSTRPKLWILKPPSLQLDLRPGPHFVCHWLNEGFLFMHFIMAIQSPVILPFPVSLK